MSDPNTATTTSSVLQPPARLRGGIRAAATGALALAAIAALLLAFAWPWVAPFGEGAPLYSTLLYSAPLYSAPLYSAPPLSRYAPLRDGAASLILVTDASGKPAAWRSSNVRVLLDARAVTTDLRPSFRDAISQIYASRAKRDIGDDNLPDLLAQYRANIYQVSVRTLDTSGRITETISIGVRDEQGDHFVGMYDAAHNIELLYDPPLSTPPDLTPGRVWTSSGQVVGLDYQTYNRVLEAEVYDSTPSHFDDCLNIETAFVLSRGDETLSTSTSQDRYCAGIGVVESHQSENGTPTGHNKLLSNPSGVVDPLPINHLLMSHAGDAAIDVMPDGDPRDGTWQLTHWSQALLSDEVGESTIPPEWIPGNPPMVLAAASGGDLIAFDASDDTSVVLWRFHPGGAIYSPPAYNRGRIYFGASDKRLYALDTRGLFLWSYETGDNIATRPVVVSDTVLFGSEDRNIYALDTQSGRLRWKVSTGGAVVSSPAIFAANGTSEDTPLCPPLPKGEGVSTSPFARGERAARPPLIRGETGGCLVIIGSDDGGVYALDVASGERRWFFTTGGPVEAPIVIVDDVAYVASRDRTLYALDAASGEQRWASGLDAVLRSAPAISGTRVFIVDMDHRLTALDRHSGKRLWTTAALYAGLSLTPNPSPGGRGESVLAPNLSPGARGESVLAPNPSPGARGEPSDSDGYLLAVTVDGEVHLLDGDGNIVITWSTASTYSALYSTPAHAFSLGPSPASNEGSVWMGDDRAVIWRLGPRPATIVPITLQRIINPYTDAAFKGVPFSVPAIPYHEQTVLVDQSANIYLFDPTTQHVTPRGKVAPSKGAPLTDPVVAADTLLSAAGDTLYATRLSDGAALWAFKGGNIYLPPAVTTDTVVVLAQHNAGSPVATNDLTGTLYALDLTSGSIRWQQPLFGFMSIGNALIRGNTVYIGTPPATFDLATGQARWSLTTADLGALGLGGSALSEQGDSLFVGVVNADGTGGVAAIDTATGAVRWLTNLGTDYLRFFECLWVSGDSVIIPSGRGTRDIIALDAHDGAIRWRYNPPVARFGAITVAQGRVWLLLQNGRLLALDAGDGERVARFGEVELDLQTALSMAQRPAIIRTGADTTRIIVPAGDRLLVLALEDGAP